MQRLMIPFVVLTLVAFVGCSNTSEKGGGGGKKVEDAKSNETFTISADNVSVKQGETKTVKVSVNRGSSFKEDVTLKVGDAPKGLKATLEPGTVKASDKETTLTISAEKDAALGKSKVKVTGKPEKGKDVDVDVEVTVKDKD